MRCTWSEKNDAGPDSLTIPLKPFNLLRSHGADGSHCLQLEILPTSLSVTHSLSSQKERKKKFSPLPQLSQSSTTPSFFSKTPPSVPTYLQLHLFSILTSSSLTLYWLFFFIILSGSTFSLNRVPSFSHLPEGMS